MKTIEELLREIRPEFDFAGSKDFIGDGMLDSFDMVSLVAELDRNFGICIAGVDILPEHFQNLTSIQTLVRKYTDL